MKSLFNSWPKIDLGAWPKGGLGVVTKYTIAAAIIFAAQVFPLPGYFFAILGGSLFIGALAHIMMIDLGVTAIRGRIGRAWLLAPVAYYAGGYYLYLQSVDAARAAAAAIEAANAEQTFHGDTPFTYLSAGGNTLELLAKFKTGVAYEKTPTQDGFDYTAYFYAKGSDCEGMRPSSFPEKETSSPVPWERDLFSSYRGEDKSRQCIIATKVKIAHPRYQVTSEFDHETPTTLLYRQSIETWTARDLKSDTIVATARAGVLTPLPPVQFIIAGCAPHMRPPSWNCGIELAPGPRADRITVAYKQRSYPKRYIEPNTDPESSQSAALAHALGLQPRSPTD